MKRTEWHRNAALVVPLLLVNTAAVYGQAGWAYDHLGHGRIVAVLFAAAVESIGVYLAAEAHAALMAGDASARLRGGSYLIGALVGVLNYAHFAGAGYTPNPVALTFGLLSSISPWLWAIRSRSLNRDRLRELGQIDPRAVRFSLLRWTLFPKRTGHAFRYAVWHGIVQPAEAITAAEATTPVATVPPAPEPVKPDTTTPKPRAPRRDSNATRVAKAAARNPDASAVQIAARLDLSESTVRRYLPSDQRRTPSPDRPDAAPVNGVAVLADVSA